MQYFFELETFFSWAEESVFCKRHIKSHCLPPLSDGLCPAHSVLHWRASLLPTVQYAPVCRHCFQSLHWCCAASLPSPEACPQSWRTGQAAWLTDWLRLGWRLEPPQTEAHVQRASSSITLGRTPRRVCHVASYELFSPQLRQFLRDPSASTSSFPYSSLRLERCLQLPARLPSDYPLTHQTSDSSSATYASLIVIDDISSSSSYLVVTTPITFRSSFANKSSTYSMYDSWSLLFRFIFATPFTAL